jgi:hypothetical protein
MSKTGGTRGTNQHRVRGVSIGGQPPVDRSRVDDLGSADGRRCDRREIGERLDMKVNVEISKYPKVTLVLAPTRLYLGELALE